MSTSQLSSLIDRENLKIRTRSTPSCYLCASQGELLYENLEDRVFGCPGQWNFRRCSDPACRLMWMDPMPEKEDIGLAYSHYYTHEPDAAIPSGWLHQAYHRMHRSYLGLRFNYGLEGAPRWKRLWGLWMYLLPHRRAEADAQFFYLSSASGSSLLDVGCGNGRAMDLLKTLGWQVEGIDADPNAVQRARSRGLQVRQGSLEEQSYPDSSFDVIIMSHVIEHVHDPLSLMKECYRILKPGGRLITVTPNAGGWGHARYGCFWRGLEPPRHLHIFSVSSLRLLSLRAGFLRAEYLTGGFARSIIVASAILHDTGKLNASSHASLATRLKAEALSLLEKIWFHVDNRCQEEVFQISHK
jgi:methionine biosynthesis protein MetW